MADCGACSACCYLMSVPSLKKPACLWCAHTSRPHGGCEIYADRPNECVEYRCLWLVSQDRAPEERMIADARPDRSKVMLHDARDPDNPNRVYVHVFPDHPTAWLVEPINDHIKAMRSRGVTVQVMIGDRTIVLEPGGDERHVLEGPAERTAFRQLPV